MNLLHLLVLAVTVPGTVLTNTIVVGIVALTHVQIATFIIGATTLVAVSEGISMARGDERHARLAKSLMHATVYVFGFGAAIAIFFVLFVLTGLWGHFYLTLQDVLFWPFVLEAFTFIAEVILIYTLYAQWERLEVHRLARLGMVILLNMAQWWQMFLIDVIASSMLTPSYGITEPAQGGTTLQTNLLLQMLNPTQLPLTLHRTVGNIAWAAAALTLFAAVKYLRATKRERAANAVPATLPARSVGAMAVEQPRTVASERAYWDWVGHWGMIWVMALSLLQPYIGYSYAKEIQLHAYSSWYTMMFGGLSDVFLFQITLFALIVILGVAYMWRRLKAENAPHNWRSTAAFWVSIVALFIGSQPAWFSTSYQSAVSAAGNRPFWQGGLLNPFGDFIPYKVIALLLMVVVGMYMLSRYTRHVSRHGLRFGAATRRSQWLLVALGITVSVMMLVMGIIRETSRNGYLIQGELTIQGQRILQPDQAPPEGNP